AAQLADEISHVRFANAWIRRKLKEEPRTILQIGTALAAASKAFRIVMGSEGTEGVEYPAAEQARRDAGFTDEEVVRVFQLAAAKHAARQEFAAHSRSVET